MLTSRRFTHSVVVLATAIGATATSAGIAEAAPPAPLASCDAVQDPPAQLPAGVEDGDRLFVTQYRGLLVQITCGRLELVEPTGWASCYFLYGDEVLGYPC